MAFTAADVKTLREMTGVGMLDCKKALAETDGDMDKAVELLREKGLSISEIGGRVGYDSAGKFTGAFKKVMHLTPSEYRRERGTRYEE